MYLDKLDGNITSSFYEQKTNEWRAQQDRLRQTINELRLTTLAPLDQAVNLLDMASQACHRFTNQPPEEQRRLLTTWKEGELSVTPARTIQNTPALELGNCNKQHWDSTPRTRFWDLAPHLGRI